MIFSYHGKEKTRLHLISVVFTNQNKKIIDDEMIRLLDLPLEVNMENSLKISKTCQIFINWTSGIEQQKHFIYCILAKQATLLTLLS